MMMSEFPVEGQDVMLIASEVSPDAAFAGTAYRTDPLTVQINTESALAPGTKAIVIYQKDGVYHTLTSQVVKSTVRGGITFCEIRTTAHENLERRRSDRYPVEMGCELGFMGGTGQGLGVSRAYATIKDISKNGAWVTGDVPHYRGVLYNVQIPLPGDAAIRALGICTRIRPKDGFAIDFVDFIGGSQQLLVGVVDGLANEAA
jgi:hypothetical protein